MILVLSLRIVITLCLVAYRALILHVVLTSWNLERSQGYNVQSIFEYILNVFVSVSCYWTLTMATKPTQKEAMGYISRIVNLVIPLELLGT